MTPDATELLQEEGAELALADLADEVSAAAQDMRDLLAEDKERTWDMRELQDAAANGRSASVMSLAFLRLFRAGELRIVDRVVYAV